MKKITLTLYILFYSIIQNAQIPEINWGQKYSVRGRGKAIGHTDDYFLIRHDGRKNKKLIQVNLEDNIIKKISLDFKFKGDEVFIDKIINTASADYLLGSNHHKKSQRTFVHATPISASGQIGKSLEHLYTYDYKRHKSWSTNDQHNQDVMGVKLSQDSTKVIFTNVTSNKDHRKKKYKDEYIINVFNDKLEKLWEKKLNFLLADQDMTILQYEISNTGDVYILTKDEVRERRNKYGWCLPYDFTLVKVSTDGNVQKVKIDVGEDYAKHARMHVDKKGNVFALGYFTEKEKRDVLRLEHGIFFNKYNSNGEILIQKRHRWEEDFYTKLKEEHHFKNGSYARSDGFYVNDISVDYKRKSMTLISEYCYKIIQKSYDGRSKETTRYEYSHANHLIIPSFDFDGNLKWTSCIEKESDTSFFRGNTISIEQDGNLYLIFNDKKTRKERSKINAKNKFGDTFTDFARINSTGEVDMRKIILNSQETGIYFSPHNSSYIGNGMILLFGRDNKSARHGLLKLP